MKKTIAVICVGLLTGSMTLAGKAPEGDGWISLFNGKDLTGWVTPARDHTWKVIDGVIDYEAQGGNLATEQEFGDYQLHIEWRFKRTAGGHYNAKIFNPDGTQKKDENGNEQPAPLELVRLAFPRRVYTQSHFDYLVEVLADVGEKRERISGYSITHQSKFLRHFTCRFKKI